MNRLSRPLSMVLYIIFALMTSISASGASSGITREQAEDALRRLDGEMKNAEAYKAARIARIDSAKTQLSMLNADSDEWLEKIMRVARLYTSFNNDSALHYYTRGYDAAVRCHADSMWREFRMRRATYLPIGGFIKDGIDEYRNIDTTMMSTAQKRSYFDAGRQMYNYIGAFYDSFLSEKEYWNKFSMQSQQNLLDVLDKQSDEYKLNYGENLFFNREYAKSEMVLNDLLRQIKHDTSTYAIACHILAAIAASRGDINGQIYYLAESAIADVRTATMEVTSLQELGGLLFEMGDTERSHYYLMHAMRNVVDSRASVRMLQTTQLVTVVEQAHQHQIKRWRTMMYVVFGVLILMLLVLFGMVWVNRKQLRKVSQMKDNLEEANRTKEVYLSRFLTLCSIYIEKLKELCNLTSRKISAGQVEELSRIVKSGKFIEEQSREFYAVFDDAFLHIYPSFVEKVNELLRPDEQIELEEGELLNTDLRILAFMRLGIDDATRVAQILNYSVNTIYAYRNKLRNKAINRATFETDILKIGTD